MQVFLEFKGRAGVFALRAPGPESIGGLFLFGGGGTDTFLYTAEPAACGVRLSMGRGFQAVERFVFLVHLILI